MVGWVDYTAVVRHGPCLVDRRASASFGPEATFALDRRACSVLFQGQARPGRLQAPSAPRHPMALPARRPRLAGQIHKAVGRRMALDLRRDHVRLAGIPVGLQQDRAPIPADLLQDLMPRKKGVGSLAAGLPAGRFPQGINLPYININGQQRKLSRSTCGTK